MEHSISLTDLRSDLAQAEAEVGRAEEAARLAVQRRDELVDLVARVERYVKEREQAQPKLQPVLPLRPVPTRKPAHRELTVAERVIEILEGQDRFMTTRELVTELEKRGYRPKSAKKRPYDAVYGSLHGALKIRGTRLVNKDAKWGLSEWVGQDREVAQA
ncbi:MAG: HTH domain-containing protein [Acidobacteriota bacterium]